jgi:hypothetical protein
MTRRKKKGNPPPRTLVMGVIVNPIEVTVVHYISSATEAHSEKLPDAHSPIDGKVAVSPKAGETHNSVDLQPWCIPQRAVLMALKECSAEMIPDGVTFALPLIALVKREDIPFLTDGSTIITQIKVHETNLDLSSANVSPRVVPESPKGGTDEY